MGSLWKYLNLQWWYELYLFTNFTLIVCHDITIGSSLQGADLIAGSLIKNPGGTIAPCGGYVAGRKIWVEAAAARLSAPGLGVECGSTPGDVMRTLFQGIFLAPQMVGEAIKVIFKRKITSTLLFISWLP